MLSYKDYCDEKTSDELEKLGYPRYHYDATEVDKIFRIISLYDAQKWLREEKHIDVLVYLDDLKGYFPVIRIWEGSWKTFVNLEEMEGEKVAYSANYEEALSEGLRTAIEILKILKEG